MKILIWPGKFVSTGILAENKEHGFKSSIAHILQK